MDDNACRQQLQWANEVLDNEDPSEVWKVGKAMKKLVEMEDSKMTPDTLSTIYFVWGSALARLAAADNDVTLATAAIDKFEHVERLSSRVEVGATGMVLWASCKLIVAMENHDLPEIHRAIRLFEEALKLETDDAFEITFQFANALKDVAEFMDYTSDVPKLELETIVSKGIDICTALYDEYFPQAVCNNEDDEDDSVCTTLEDMSDVNVLLAKFYAFLPDLTKSCEYFFRATDLAPLNYHTLIECTRYLVKFGDSMLDNLKEIEHRCEIALKDLNTPEEEDNPALALLLDAIGQNLVQQMYIRQHQGLEIPFALQSHAKEYLEDAHRLNPELGCYQLAKQVTTNSTRT